MRDNYFILKIKVNKNETILFIHPKNLVSKKKTVFQVRKK